MKKALVTGGAGFIGSHFCEKLLQLGYTVFCLDNLYTGNKRNIQHLETNPNFVFIVADVSSAFEVEVSEIYNFACPASPLHYQSNPLFTISTSVNGAIKMGTLAQKIGCKLFHASTSEVYGDPLVHPQQETYLGNVNPIGIRACYDESKRLAESILFVLFREKQFPLKLGRIFNTYGPRMSDEDGRAISNFIIQSLNNDDITVYGEGKQTRSFCYISDLVDAIIKFMHTSEKVTGPINLGSEFEYSVIDIAKLIIKLTGSKSRIIHMPLPPDDPVMRRPDLSRAKELLNWEPKVTLEEGLKKTIEYYKFMHQI